MKQNCYVYSGIIYTFLIDKYGVLKEGGDMLKYTLLFLCATPVIKGQLPEGRITTFGSQEEDDYPAFRTHNFTAYENGGFTITLPLCDQYLYNIHIYYILNQKLTLENMNSVAVKGRFVLDEENRCWKFSGFNYALHPCDDFEYVLRLQAEMNNVIYKQYRKIIERVQPEAFRHISQIKRCRPLDYLYKKKFLKEIF